MDSPDKLRVFISYARADGAALAEELNAGLALLGFLPVMDKRDIAGAEDWESRLATLVRQADTVVFVLSPRSVQSPRCAWEVQQAQALSKRIVPVIAQPVDEAEVPAALRRLNFIDFSPGQSIVRALGRLAETLRVDLAWIREHTRIAELAARWADRGHDEALLLRGAELELGQAWATRWHAGAPEVTPAQRAYLAASAEAEAARASVERLRLNELTQAAAVRTEALAAREQALGQLRRRTLLGGAGAAVLSAGLSVLAVLYARDARELERQRQLAATAAARALDEAARREALREDLEGQIVVYASWVGTSGADDAGFSRALLEEMRSELVPLGTAVARTVRKVQLATQGRQRPYVSTDLNGELYLRLAPPSRRRQALMVTLDHVGAGRALPGVARDGAAWHDLLARDGQWSVQWLKNPRMAELQSALAAWARAERVAAPAQPASGAGAAGAPPANTLGLIYLAGPTFGQANDRHLALEDTPLDDPRAGPARLAASAIRVQALSQFLRDNFAASCLVLDT